MKIDAFPHIFPKAFFDRMVEVAPDKGAIKRWLHIPVLWDLDARLRMMDEFEEYTQILTLSLPTSLHSLAFAHGGLSASVRLSFAAAGRPTLHQTMLVRFIAVRSHPARSNHHASASGSYRDAHR